MHLRIDRAIKPSGLIASAKTFSLVVDDGGLYVVHTGPAGNAVSTRGPIERMAVNTVYNRIERKVREGEARLDQGDYRALAGEKHGEFLPRAEITAVDVEERHSEIRLAVRAGKKKHAFRLAPELLAEVQQLQLLLNGAG